MKILIIQHKMIGDVLITSLLCENLKRAYPNASVDYLVNSNTLPILENNPYIDNIIVFDKNEDEKLFKLIEFCKNLNKNKYDVVIDAYSKLQSWVNVYINDAPKKISYKKIGRTFLYTDNVIKHKNPYSNLGLAIEHRLALLKPMGINKPVVTEPKLYLTEHEINHAKESFKEHQVDSNRKTIMISLLGSVESKTYPLNEMAKLVDYLGTNYNVNILFNYFPKQRKEAEFVYNKLSAETKSKIHFDLLGGDLRSFIALANECELIIGNDGGAVNMTKALNKKSFIIFAPHVEKKIWSTFEDGKKHISVHAKDYLTEIYNKNSKNKIENKINSIYSQFKFDLFKEKLKYFLDLHIK